MISAFAKTTAITLCVSLFGCASAQKTSLSDESRHKIKSIAFIDVDEPDKYFLNPGQLPGGAALYAFGALGGLILGSVEASRADSATIEFTTVLTPMAPQLSSHWNETMGQLLKSKGYDVTMLDHLPKKSDGKEIDCTSISGKYDAVFISNISAGYSIETNVEPRVVVTTKLLSSTCSETKYSDSFIYGSKALGKLTLVDRDQEFVFPSRDALLADPKKAKTALRTGLAKIAERGVSDL